jgi:hypothetical protein
MPDISLRASDITCRGLGAPSRDDGEGDRAVLPLLFSASYSTPSLPGSHRRTLKEVWFLLAIPSLKVLYEISNDQIGAFDSRGTEEFSHPSLCRRAGTSRGSTITSGYHYLQ